MVSAIDQCYGSGVPFRAFFFSGSWPPARVTPLSHAVKGFLVLIYVFDMSTQWDY